THTHKDKHPQIEHLAKTQQIHTQKNPQQMLTHGLAHTRTNNPHTATQHTTARTHTHTHTQHTHTHTYWHVAHLKAPVARGDPRARSDSEAIAPCGRRHGDSGAEPQPGRRS